MSIRKPRTQANAEHIPERPYVYALIDDSGDVFYIGKGRGRRMLQHRSDAIRGKPGVRLQRIRDVIARGGNISYRVLGEYDTDREACDAEVRFISDYESLTNITKGGEGSNGGDYKGALIRKFIELRGRILPIEQWVASIDPAIKDALIRIYSGKIEDVYLRMIDEVEKDIRDPSPTSVEWDAKTGVVTFGWRKTVQDAHPCTMRRA